MRKFLLFTKVVSGECPWTVSLSVCPAALLVFIKEGGSSSIKFNVFGDNAFFLPLRSFATDESLIDGNGYFLFSLLFPSSVVLSACLKLILF